MVDSKLYQMGQRAQSAFLKLSVDNRACGIAFIAAGVLLVAIVAYQSHNRWVKDQP